MFNKFTSVGSFASVVKSEQHRFSKFGKSYKSVTFRPKIKLHGTNAGISVDGDEITFQKRTSEVTVEKDNFGFASWASSQDWNNLTKLTTTPFTIFGEWVGKGTAKGNDVILKVDKIFAIFAIQFGINSDIDTTQIIFEPDEIREFLKPVTLPDNVYILPWQGEGNTLNLLSHTQATEFADLATKETDKIDIEDPWVKEVFGLSGSGEGLVYYPTIIDGINPINRHQVTSLMFKAKVDRHRVVKTNKAVEVSPAKKAQLSEFAKMTVTEARLEQALAESGATLDVKDTGKFIGWIAKDIKKDVDNNIVELPDDMTWKSASSNISTAARRWFFEKINTF